MKTKENTIKVSPDTYQKIRKIAKRQERSIKTTVRLAMVCYEDFLEEDAK